MDNKEASGELGREQGLSNAAVFFFSSFSASFPCCIHIFNPIDLISPWYQLRTQESRTISQFLCFGVILIWHLSDSLLDLRYS